MKQYQKNQIYLFLLFCLVASSSADERFLDQNLYLTVEWPSNALDCRPNPYTEQEDTLSRVYNKIAADQHSKYPEVYLVPAKEIQPGDEVMLKMENTSYSDNYIDNIRVLHLDGDTGFINAENIVVNYRDVSDTSNSYVLKKSHSFRIDNHVLYAFGDKVKTIRVLNCDPPGGTDDLGFTDITRSCDNFDKPACIGFYIEPSIPEQ